MTPSATMFPQGERFKIRNQYQIIENCHILEYMLAFARCYLFFLLRYVPDGQGEKIICGDPSSCFIGKKCIN